MPKRWKIFYGDGSTFTDKDGRLELVPKCNVQGIAVEDDTLGRRIESSEDFYIWTPENGGWRGANHFRMAEYLMEPGYKLVLFGRTLDDMDFRKLWDRISRDTYLPPKSGFTRKERRVN